MDVLHEKSLFIQKWERGGSLSLENLNQTLN